jgi:hypothetical protein
VAESGVLRRRSRRGNLLTAPQNLFHVGHIRLSISDIEFVPDEIVLDETDVILIEDRPREPVARRAAAGRVLPLRPFDDAVTRVWCRAANLRAFR